MKYVFYLHSHITYFVSQQVIDYLKLNLDDVLYISYRNYKYQKLTKALDLSRFDIQYDKLNKKEIDLKIKEIDYKISDYRFKKYR